MSLMPGETRQDVSDPPKGSAKCRIPQRLPAGKQRPVPYKPKPISDTAKPRFDSGLGQQQSRNTKVPSRRYDDPPSRPKSSNRNKDEGFSRTSYQNSRSPRPDRYQYKPPTTFSKKLKDTISGGKVGARPVITVPIVSQKHKYGFYSNDLPDQATIQKCEDLELEQCVLSPSPQSLSPEKMSPEPRADVRQLKLKWQQYMVQFEDLKNDLGERQKAIVEIYANMRSTHQEMVTMGQKVTLPPSEDLTIMNISKLTPDQLLQLCAVKQTDEKTEKENQAMARTPLTININKLYSLPSKMIATCDQTLSKRKEIIDWFISLKSEEQSIPVPILERKINEFNAENEMLKSSLDQAKGDFLKELNEIIDFMRKTVNEAVALQLRTEEQTHKLSELNSQNTELRKLIHNTERVMKPHKGKIEDLEKELKDLKAKSNTIKDRLVRADGQIKIGEERAAQLEARASQLEEALEQARSHNWTLENTVQQLREQNEQLQNEFDTELRKLTESIRQNTAHLEEIADAREKLQAEKEDLERRLGELSQYYNESLKAVKHDMNTNLAKLIETENRFAEEVKEKKELMAKLETSNAQLQEYESRNKELLQQLQEKEVLLSSEVSNNDKELQSTKRDLEIAVSDIDNYRIRLLKQSETIKLLERDLENACHLEEKLKTNLTSKDAYIAELEKKQVLLEEQSQECEIKMRSYEQQLSSLKSHITKLQEDFGEFENLNELRNMVNQQRTKLIEVSRENENLTQAIQNKEMELDRQLESLAEQEQRIEHRDGVINMLKEKEEEQTNIIKLLRTNLEMRTQADVDMSEQISHKNSEIEALIANVESRKQQISQLEKIILTLEEQTRKSSLLRRKDQDKIHLLEKQIAEYKSIQVDNKLIDVPPNNLDSIIKILEDELDNSFEPHLTAMSREYMIPKTNMGDRRRELQHLNSHKEINNQTVYQTEHESVPTKIVLGNFVQKTYITNENQLNNDNLDRKKAITNIDTQKWATAPDPGIIMYAPPPPDNENSYSPFLTAIPTSARFKDNSFLPRHIPFLNSNQLRDEKKCKMFKLAGHRL